MERSTLFNISTFTLAIIGQLIPVDAAENNSWNNSGDLCIESISVKNETLDVLSIDEIDENIGLVVVGNDDTCYDEFSRMLEVEDIISKMEKLVGDVSAECENVLSAWLYYYHSLRKEKDFSKENYTSMVLVFNTLSTRLYELTERLCNLEVLVEKAVDTGNETIYHIEMDIDNIHGVLENAICLIEVFLDHPDDDPDYNDEDLPVHLTVPAYNDIIGYLSGRNLVDISCCGSYHCYIKGRVEDIYQNLLLECEKSVINI